MSKKQQRKPSLDKKEVLWDNVLVEPIIQTETDGILRPQQYEDKPEWGIVIKVGQGRLLDNGETIEPQVKIGDLIEFNKYSPTKTKIEGKDYLYIHEEDILSRE